MLCSFVIDLLDYHVFLSDLLRFGSDKILEQRTGYFPVILENSMSI